MKLSQIIIMLVTCGFTYPCFAGAGTGPVTIKKVLSWTNGNVKVYVDEADKVNGLEGCTATDGSVAIQSKPEHQHGERNIIAMVLNAKATQKKMNFFVVGCCVNHNKKSSPCIRTASSGK